MKKDTKNIQAINVKEGIKDFSKKSNSFIEEFKKFIARGNVMDLAVGVIVGNAFSKIVTSLTNNILMPLIGIVVGGFNFSTLSYNFKIWGREVIINYGEFIQNTVDFLITAFCIFLVVKIINNVFTKKEIEKKEEKKEPVKSDEVKLLEEIRDLLKEKQN